MSPAFATLLCFVVLPLLVFLPLLWLCDWLARRLQIPREVWEAYHETWSESCQVQICKDRFGWFVVEPHRGLVVFSDSPVIRGWNSGKWLVSDRETGEVLSHGKWRRTWVRYPPPPQRASLFRLWEM